MHAIAGTIGHDLITDEYARQQAKQASRERFYAGLGGNVIIVDDPYTLTGGASTPSAAASPPHDAEADREAKRLEAAKHLEFLRTVRAWADGEPGTFTVDEAARQLAKVRETIDTLGHLARQAGEESRNARTVNQREDRWYFAGKADAFTEVVDWLTAALR